MSVMQLSQAVVWNEGNGTGGVSIGRLDLEDDVLVLSGTDADGKLTGLRLPYEDLTGVRVGRSEEDRLRGAHSLVVERRAAPPLRVAAVGGAGALIEVGDLLAALIAERSTPTELTAVVLPLREGARERALELIRRGPPFDLEASRFARHHVFVTDREAVFVFEGPDVRATAESLVRDPAVWRAAAAWRDCLGGRPRVADEAYGWSRATAARHP